MVDAVLGTHSTTEPQVTASSPAALATTFVQADAAVVARYRAFAAGLPTGPAQHPVWVEAWAATSSADLAMIEVSHHGATVLMMPLEIIKRRGLTLARAIGGSHANGNFPAIASGFSQQNGADLANAVIATVQRARLGVDLLLIERQIRELHGVANPFAQLASTESPNVALAVDLRMGFDAVLDRVGRKRRLKKHRAQTRKLEAAGGFMHREAASDQDVGALLGAFLQQKADRFRKLGIDNVFVDVRPFFEALFKRSLLEADRPFKLQALEVDGKIRAVTGSSQIQDRIICEFGSITEDELVQVSPGDFLSFLNIEKAAKEGAAIYDFSVGDEPYKRSWCNLVEHQFDTIAPVTAKGRAYATLLTLVSGAKRRVKSNERLWALVKALRRSKAAASSDTAADADD